VEVNIAKNQKPDLMMKQPNENISKGGPPTDTLISQRKEKPKKMIKKHNIFLIRVN